MGQHANRVAANQPNATAHTIVLCLKNIARARPITLPAKLIFNRVPSHGAICSRRSLLWVCLVIWVSVHVSELVRGQNLQRSHSQEQTAMGKEREVN